jgi:hypothetical protein
MDKDDLLRLDARGPENLLALAYDRPPPAGSHANPHAFVCSDGKTYWVKRTAQQGLVAELIAGRVAALAGAGPVARVVEVPRAALPASGVANHLEGTGVGTLDRRGAENARHLQQFLPPQGQFDVASVDAASRAMVIAFQSWIGAGDSQVLIDLATGEVLSIDHGECFGSAATLSDPTPIVTDIPGVSSDHGRTARLIDRAVKTIEAVTDGQLLEAVACVPDVPDWRADADRRLTIAAWLAHRRDRLRGVMQSWT